MYCIRVYGIVTFTYLDIVLPNFKAILGDKVAGKAAKVPKFLEQASQVHSKT